MRLDPYGDNDADRPAWPWPAVEDDPLTVLRIPVISRDEGNFLVGFDVESEARPTDAEAALIVSFTEFVRWVDYNEHVQALMAAKAFDYDGGRSTLLLHKYAADAWGYRDWTWEKTPFFVPEPWHPEDLLKVLDRAATRRVPWQTWKAERPELFGGQR